MKPRYLFVFLPDRKKNHPTIINVNDTYKYEYFQLSGSTKRHINFETQVRSYRRFFAKMRKDKKEDAEDSKMHAFSNLDKTSVLQEVIIQFFTLFLIILFILPYFKLRWPKLPYVVWCPLRGYFLNN